jgi:hypothetical protein
MGPIGKIEPPQLQPVTAALLQIAAGDLSAETDDGSDEVKANTSAEAMDIRRDPHRRQVGHLPRQYAPVGPARR